MLLIFQYHLMHFCCHVWSYVNLPFGHWVLNKNKVFYYLFSLWNCLGSYWLCCKNFSHYSWSDPNLFLCQIVSLTVAPAFIMAGVYYLLSQMIIIHGEKYAILKPIMVSIIFIFCDVVSLFVQASGGAAAAVSLRLFKDTELGTYIMVGGIGFQVVSMTLFLYFLFDFVYRSFFTANSNIKYSFSTYCLLLFNTKREDYYKTWNHSMMLATNI